MKTIQDTELILSKDKKIYHLNLNKKQIADDIILVGDHRVSRLVNILTQLNTWFNMRIYNSYRFI